MFSFLLPKAVKQGRQFVQDARKMAAYKRDLWDESTRTTFDEGIVALEKATDTRDTKKIEEAAHHLDKLCHQYLPKIDDAAWRENVEVFLVAIVVALAVRTYFLQPFTIPTGSMQPTLNGILGHPTESEPPNALMQVVHTAVYGRTWLNTIAKDDEEVLATQEVQRLFFFTYTQITTDRNIYTIHAPARTLGDFFFVGKGARYEKGQPIARGYVDTGDHVFVDKLTYHFRRPRRGEVIVFNTQGLPTQENRLHQDGPSQFYIKRLTGEPGDELRIDPPQLFINGQPGKEEGFQRVMSAANGYGGYVLGFPQFQMPFLKTPDSTYTVPEKHYFAMGDNSAHSSDSRDWGPVPQQNMMGRGMFVYWPFVPHWGFIR